VITYVVRRAGQAVVVLVLVSVLVFGIRWLPGGPKRESLGVNLHGPAVVQYLTWFGQVLHGNLGFSTTQGSTVGALLAHSLPRTLTLTLTATLLAIVIGVPVGFGQALRRDQATDLVVRGLTYLSYGMPSFFLGSILIFVFAVKLKWFGAEGPQASGIAGILSDWRDLALPVLTLAAFIGAVFARYARAAAVESLASDYVRTARGAGASSVRIVVGHVLRNSLIPVITLAGLSLPQIVGGALVVESLFNIEGVGWQLWQGALKHDFPVLFGFILVVAAGAVAGSLIADIGYAIADPRVRYQRR